MKRVTLNIWNLLGQVHSLRLTATTGDRRSYFHNAAAAGRVKAARTGSRVITFDEAGEWTSRDHRSVDFHNIYRWSLGDPEDIIGLTHLRYGIDHPVHLVDFVPLAADSMQSIDPHCCGADHYNAGLSLAENRIHLSWRIQGPIKNDTLDCIYLTRNVSEIPT